MRLITNIVLAVFKWALVIGVAGGLTDMTLAMRAEAVRAHRTGLISLKKLNDSLVGPSE